MPPQSPSIGQDVTDLFPVGADVSALFGATPAEPSLWERTKKAAIPTALRVIPAVAGAAAGSLIPIPGVGTLAGGAAGAGVGETLAEAYETWTGDREGMNPTQILTQTALGAVPMGRAASTMWGTVARRGVQGALLGGAGSAATDLAEGNTPTLAGVATGAGLGATMGAAFGGLEGRAAGRARKPAAPAPSPTAASAAASPAPSLGADVTDLINAVKRGTAPDVPDTSLEALVKSVKDADETIQNFNVNRVADTLPREGTVPPVAAAAPPPPSVGQDVTQMFLFKELETPPAAAAAPAPPPVPAPTAPAPLATAALDEIDPAPSIITTGAREAERNMRVMGVEVPPTQPITRDARKFRMAASLPAEQQDDFLRVVEQNGGFETQRRGVVPDARVEEVAKWIQVDTSRTAPKRTILPAEETKALANALVTINDKVSKLSQQVLAGAGTNLDRVQLAQARMEQAMVAASLYGNAAEQGRALRAQRLLGAALATNEDRWLAEALKDPNIRNLPDFAAEWAKLTTDQQRLEFLRNAQKLTKWQVVESYRYANLLSGIKTHLRNVFGTTSNAAFRLGSTVPALGYDVARAKVTGAPRTMFASEAGAAAQGAVVGLKRGFDAALFTLTHGYGPNMLSAFDVPRPELGPLGIGKYRIGTASTNPFNWPGRMLEGMDQFMGGVFGDMTLYQRLYAKARTEVGDDADKIAAKVAEWTVSPPKEIVEAATRERDTILFREDPGKAVTGFIRWANDAGVAGKVIRFVLPFIKVPANIFRQGLESNAVTGLAMPRVREALAAGGREQAEQVGRLVTGTTGLGILAYWASQGKLSGAGPSDPEQKAALRESGWRPYSVKVGDAWIDYTIPFQSLMLPLTMMAEAWDEYHRTEEAPNVVQILAALPKTAFDQSFLSGVADFNAAMTDPDRFLRNYAGRSATGYVPFSGMLRNVTQAVDPTSRQVRSQSDVDTVWQNVKTVVPGLAQTVDPELDRFGKPVVREREQAISPFAISREASDPLVRELTRLKVDFLGVPTRTMDIRQPNGKALRVQLTSDERQQVGRSTRQALELLVRNPGWAQLDEAAARELIRSTAERARTSAVAQIRQARRASGGTQERLQDGDGGVTLTDEQMQRALRAKDVDVRAPFPLGSLPKRVPVGTPYPFNVPPMADLRVSQQAARIFKMFPGLQETISQIVTTPNKHVLRRMSDADVPLNRYADTNLMGSITDATREVYINPKQSDEELINTLAHELAHANGWGEATSRAVGNTIRQYLRAREAR